MKKTKTDEERAQEAHLEKESENIKVDSEDKNQHNDIFGIDILSLRKIVDKYRERLKGDDDIKEIESQGGITGLMTKLKTERYKGIDIDDNVTIQKRKTHFGSNKVFEKEIPHFCVYVLDALNDTMLIVLIVAAVVQIILGVLFSDEPERDWIDGFSILIAVVVVVSVSSITNWKKEHQFKDLSDEQKKSTVFNIIRNGKAVTLQSEEILVGDIINVNYGEILPADVILIDGNNIKTDEAALTGESNEMKKNSYEECQQKIEEEIKNGMDIKKITLPSPVLLSGTKIESGNGHGIVVAVGKNSQKGQLQNMVDNAQEDAQTPLEEKLERIAKQIGYFGIGAGVVTLIAMSIRLAISFPKKVGSYNEDLARNSVLKSYAEVLSDVDDKDLITRIAEVELTKPSSLIGGEILNIVLLVVSIIVVAIPEGLPLAVTLALAFSIRKMMDKQNLVRKMHACETMGGANIICTDKTGTLTKNEMTVTKIFNCKTKICVKELNNQGVVGKLENGSTANDKTNKEDLSGVLDADKKYDDYLRYFNENYFTLLKIGLAVNSDVTLNDLSKPDAKGYTEEIQKCNKTDFAFVNFLHLLHIMINPLRKTYYPSDGNVKQIPFNSKRKRMTTLIASSEFPTGYRLFTKGGADFLLKNVAKIIDPDTLETKDFNDEKNKECLEVMKQFNSETLRTLSVCYKDISKEEYENFGADGDDDPKIDKEGLILIAIFGIKDILRPTVPHAVAQCHKAGVTVCMITGDNLFTAVAIAKECNILPEDMDMNNIEKEPETELKTEEDKKEYYQNVVEQKPFAITGNTFYNAVGGLVCETCGKEAEKECKCARTAEEAKHLKIKEIRKDKIGNMENFKKITANLRVMARSQPTHKYAMALGLKALHNVVGIYIINNI